MIERGLVIDKHWVQKILAGSKRWEIRNKTNAITGRIGLCQGGGPIVATANIGCSISFADAGEFERLFDNHQVTNEQRRDFYGDQDVYAWPLSDVQKLDPPIPYKHPGGGSWVKLSEKNVTDYERLQRG